MGKLSPRPHTENLRSAVLPERGPEITGLSSHYAVGENVTANCTSWPSVPKANLHWTINGNVVKYPSLPTARANFHPLHTRGSSTSSRVYRLHRRQRARVCPNAGNGPASIGRI